MLYVPNQFLARAFIVDIPLTIFCIMEVDVAIYVLRVIAILIITIIALKPVFVRHFNTCTDTILMPEASHSTNGEEYFCQNLFHFTLFNSFIIPSFNNALQVFERN